MILTLVFLFLVLVGITCILSYCKTDAEGWQITGVCLVAIFGLCLLVCTIEILTREVEAQGYIVKIEAARETLGFARANTGINSLELAAIQQKAMDKNEWIANAQFWASHPLTSWFWSRQILEIKPIR